MDARDAMQGSAEEAERPQMDQAEARRGFRPLALPALAAAARARKSEARVTPGAVAERQGILAIVHEDAPLL